MSHLAQTRRFIQGFSLVEMSIVLVIMSIVLTGGLLGAANFAQHQAFIDTEKRIDDIHASIMRFHAREGYLPCPARLNVALDDAAFGDAILNNGCEADTTIISGTSRVATGSQAVRIGALPTRAFGMADEMASDAWGNRFIYAVTEEHTTVETFSQTTGLGATSVASNPGMINIQSAGGIAATNVSYVVVSLGENGRKRGGHRHYTGVLTASCTGSGRDVENCDGDVDFMETLVNDGDNPNNYFDDFIRYRKHSMLRAMGLGNITTECTSTNEGIVRYASGTGTREFCDGNTWENVPDSTSIVASAVACYAFETGMIRVDPATIDVGSTDPNDNVLQECDGAVWNNVF